MYGDSEVMRRRAGELREQGVDLRALADRVVARTDDVGWTGRAAAALDERIRVRATRLREVAGRHDDAAEALDEHRDAVDHLKEAIEAVERRAAALAADHGLSFVAPAPGHRGWLTIDLPGL